MADGRAEFEARFRIDRLDRGVGVGALVALDRRRIGFRLVGDDGLRHDLLRDQQRMREVRGRDLAGRHDDARAHLGPVPHLGGEGHRHADAAMRCRIARQDSGMHRDTRPGDALHERHRRAAVDVGVVHLVLLDDAEHTHRGRVTLHAGRDRAFGEQTVGVVDPDPLLLDRDVDDQRPLRLGAGFLFRGLVLAGRRLARPRLARRRARRGTVITGIGILPVEQRGVGLHGGAERACRRQNGDLPKALVGRDHAHTTRPQNPISAHALNPQNPEISNPAARYSFVVADAKSVHQRKPSNPSAFRP